MDKSGDYTNYNNGLDDLELSRVLHLSGLRHEIVNAMIPQWYSAVSDFTTLLGNFIVDSGYSDRLDRPIHIVKDYLTDGVSSNRIRLVPPELSLPISTKDAVPVTELIVNVPASFVRSTDGSEYDIIQVALLTLVSQGDVYKRIAVTNGQVLEFSNFDELEFGFTEIDDKEEVAVSLSGGNENVSSMDEQLEMAELIYELLAAYKLGKQSRKDGTL